MIILLLSLCGKNEALKTLLQNTKQKENKEGEVRTEVVLHQELHLRYISLVQGPIILGMVQYKPSVIL